MDVVEFLHVQRKERRADVVYSLAAPDRCAFGVATQLLEHYLVRKRLPSPHNIGFALVVDRVHMAKDMMKQPVGFAVELLLVHSKASVAGVLGVPLGVNL